MVLCCSDVPHTHTQKKKFSELFTHYNNHNNNRLLWCTILLEPKALPKAQGYIHMLISSLSLSHMHAHYKYMHYKTIRLFWQMLSKILYPMMKPRNLKMPTRLPFFTSHTAVDPSLSIQNNFDEKTLRHFGGQPGSLMCTVPHY